MSISTAFLREPDPGHPRRIDVPSPVARPFTALLFAAALVVTVAGCAPTPVTTSTTPTSAAAQATPCRTSASGTTQVLSEANTGSTVCLRVGDRLEVYLHGTPGAPWTPIAVDGTAVGTAVSGKGTLALGVTGGFFVATRPGAARLTSARPACRTPASASVPCTGDTFAVDVQVR